MQIIAEQAVKMARHILSDAHCWAEGEEVEAPSPEIVSVATDVLLHQQTFATRYTDGQENKLKQLKAEGQSVQVTTLEGDGVLKVEVAGGCIYVDPEGHELEHEREYT